MLFKLLQNIIRFITNNRKQWISFNKHCCNALNSPNGFAPSTTPQKKYSKDYWFPNMVWTNHTTKDLQQHKILDFSKYCLLLCHIKMEKVNGRENLRCEVVGFDNHRTDPVLVACQKLIALQHMEQSSVKYTLRYVSRCFSRLFVVKL